MRKPSTAATPVQAGSSRRPSIFGAWALRTALIPPPAPVAAGAAIAAPAARSSAAASQAVIVRRAGEVGFSCLGILSSPRVARAGGQGPA